MGAIYTLLPAARGLRETLHLGRDGHPAWMAAALAATAAGLVASAVQLMGTTQLRLPLARTVRVQLAGAFADVTAPAGLGRLGVDARYLRHAGLDPAAASASVALDALGGVVAHVVLLVATIVVAGAAPRAALPHVSTWVWLALIAVVVVGAVVATRIPRDRWRHVADTIAAGVHAADGTLRRPDKRAQLLGGAASVTVLQILALDACVHAFDVHASVVSVALVYLVGGSAASVVPTPGGLGAVEAALVGGLVAAGAEPARAAAAVVTFRLVTFWAPLLPGAAAFFHLRRDAVV